MSDDAPTCEVCGHERFEHRPVVVSGFPRPEGTVTITGYYGACEHTDGVRCSCLGYKPDRLPHVTELLGLDVRRVVP